MLLGIQEESIDLQLSPPAQGSPSYINICQAKRLCCQWLSIAACSAAIYRAVTLGHLIQTALSGSHPMVTLFLLCNRASLCLHHPPRAHPYPHSSAGRFSVWHSAKRAAHPLLFPPLQHCRVPAQRSLQLAQRGPVLPVQWVAGTCAWLCQIKQSACCPLLDLHRAACSAP